MNKSNPKSKINYIEKHYFKRDDFSDLKEMIYILEKLLVELLIVSKIVLYGLIKNHIF